MISSTAIFVGAFSHPDSALDLGSSAAGDQVQAEILQLLGSFLELKGISLRAVALRPLQSWPRGPVWSKAMKAGCVGWPSFLNLPVLKQLSFSFSLAVKLILNKPKIVLFYNADLFSSAAVIIYRFVFRRVRVIGIVQDVLTYPGCSRAKSIGYSVALRLARSFDIIVPISQDIAEDFRINNERVVVFNGGLTRQAKWLRSQDTFSVDPRIAIFAGALESYNGIDRIIDKWPDSGDIELHIFGKGTYEGRIKELAARNRLVIFHGYCTEEVVSSWMCKAMINFCLRYPVGIETKYFFPSKFFNVMAAPGMPVVNRFYGLPFDAAKLCLVVNDSLANFLQSIEEVFRNCNLEDSRSSRLEWLADNADWSKVIRQVIERAIEE